MVHNKYFVLKIMIKLQLREGNSNEDAYMKFEKCCDFIRDQPFFMDKNVTNKNNNDIC